MLEKILATMKARGVRQDALERMCGLSENRISKWKNNQGEPTAKQLLRIADVLGLPMRYLADDSMDRPDLELDEVQRRILWLAEQVGYDVAVKRLANAPETQKAPAPVEGTEAVRPLNITVRKDLRGPSVAEIRPKDPAPRVEPKRPNHSK